MLRRLLLTFMLVLAGFAAGTRSYALGALGAVGFSLVALYLAHVPFAARKSGFGMFISGCNRWSAPYLS